MKGRGRGASPDLLVCFPSRAHLGLIQPKPICSPSRASDPGKRHNRRGLPSPLFRPKTGKRSGHGAAEEGEPTSPTVTCAGQIKIQPRSSSAPNPKPWISMLQDFDKLQCKKPLMQFLGALRSLRLDLRCFGSFNGSVDCSTDEEGENEAEEVEEEGEEMIYDKEFEGSSSSNIFSKWFMLLDENQKHKDNRVEEKAEEGEAREEEELVPPPNALLLMRCRSAPAKGNGRRENLSFGLELSQEEEEQKEKDRLLLMRYGPDFVKLSTEISKETWVVGNFEPLARSRSWKR